MIPGGAALEFAAMWRDSRRYGIRLTVVRVEVDEEDAPVGEAAIEAAIMAMRIFLETELAAADLDRIEASWRRHGLPADRLRREVEVSLDPGSWRDLLPPGER